MSAAILAFERDYAVQRRSARLAFFGVTAVLLVLFLLTAEASNFFKITQVNCPQNAMVSRGSRR